MKIHFFEEFPTTQNLKKIAFVDWPCTLYLAARSLKEFNLIPKKKGITYGYWPVLEQKEGYWLSPFSTPKAVRRIIREIKEAQTTPQLLWDAELPLRHPWLFLRLDNFARNRRRIRTFIRQNSEHITTCEYPLKSRLSSWLLNIAGVSFSPKKFGNRKIIMYYTSMHEHLRPVLLKAIATLHQKYGKALWVGVGTIAKGILGTEQILFPARLERDLNDLQGIGVENVVIFRLGGMNGRYRSVLKRFL